MSLEAVNMVQRKKHYGREQERSSQRSTQCYHCGHNWPHRDGRCPATGSICTKCGKPNHYAAVCLSKTFNRQGQFSRPQQQHNSPRTHDHPKLISRVHQVSSQPVSSQPVLSQPVSSHPCILPNYSSSSSEDEYLYTLDTDQDYTSTKAPEVSVNVHGIPVTMIIDTGASTNILDEST